MKLKVPIELLQRYLAGKATEAEIRKVDQWYATTSDNEGQVKDASDELPDIKERIYQRIQGELGLPATQVPFYRRTYFRWSAAAVLVFLIAASYLLLNRPAAAETVSITGKEKELIHDIAPPANSKAILTLADGTKIELDSTTNGRLAVEGKIRVTKKSEGQIVYDGVASDQISFNTLSVPKGSKPMQLLLADGSEVWLNVASSITYPTAFSGKERIVEIVGEAYFEIAKNKEMPFIVKKMKEDVEVKVTGTHFNVNAYGDEKQIKVTLLEGGVTVRAMNETAVLVPGEQAQIGDQKIQVVNDENIEEVMAWKNGRFYFDGSDIKTIMRQVEKWYDVDIVYESVIPYSFVAKISRNVNVSDLFKILELTDLVHFRIDGKEITVIK